MVESTSTQELSKEEQAKQAAAEEEEKRKTEEKLRQWKESQDANVDHGVFDRQIRIPEWNQGRVEEQVCLVLGTGGLGCGVALGLARMGVGRIILLDKDVVDLSNLNR